PYRYNPVHNEVYTIDVSQNTFAVKKDAPAAFLGTECNKGGYFKLANNYSESCTWDYERTRDVFGYFTSTSGLPPILKNELNSFDYLSGVPVTSTSPQPPEFQMEFSTTGQVPDFTKFTFNPIYFGK
ncbi:MAG: hypothetical protein IPG39_10265, partial [Bacteroidetes bacterium]|nr:hypothetical protein [Bacteroidota bacterium]